MWGKKFLAAIIISFAYFLGLIPLMFSMNNYFIAEMSIFGVLLVFTVIATLGVYNDKRWSWPWYIFVNALALLNLILVYLFMQRIFLFGIVALVAVVSFLFSVMSAESDEDYEYEKYEEKLEHGVRDDEVIVEEITPLKEAAHKHRKSEKQYVGSIKSAEYHLASCPTARKITGKNKIMFTSDSEAEEEGYKKHSCVK
ncbi:MAG: hypothetical protein V1837_05460 [Candidatus Woesearchaeota archaeon]